VQRPDVLAGLTAKKGLGHFDELPGAASLGEQLEYALAQSRCLIVICSPRAAASRWVGEEIKDPVVRVYCPECHRFAQFGRAGLVERFGADEPMPSLLRILKSCTVGDGMSGRSVSLYTSIGSCPSAKLKPSPAADCRRRGV
jgi:hypothetical protein